MAQVVNRPDSLDDLAEELAARHTEVGRRRLRRLDTVYKMLAAAASKPDQAAQACSTPQVLNHLLCWILHLRHVQSQCESYSIKNIPLLSHIYVSTRLLYYNYKAF